MSAVVGSLPSALAGAASSVAWFFPMLVAAMAYFHYDLLDPEARPVEMMPDMLLDNYDFIVVGAGSAGKLVRRNPSTRA